MSYILSIDVEALYQTEYLRDRVRNKADADRTPENVYKILDILNEYKVKSTFFFVGEIAERYQDVLKDVEKKGHEIAFHSYDHKPLWEKTPTILTTEIINFKRYLKSVNISQKIGFRAPSFSLNNSTIWALDVLSKQGVSYDSSIFPIRTPLYGVSRAPIFPYRPSHTNILKEDKKGVITEYPLLTYSFCGIRLPVAGGFYLRVLPLSVIKHAIINMAEKGHPSVLYFHTWEIDNVPIDKTNIPFFKKYITFHNIEKTEQKIRCLLSTFHFTSFNEYLSKDCARAC